MMVEWIDGLAWDRQNGVPMERVARRSGHRRPALLLAGCAVAALMSGHAARAQGATASASTVELDPIEVQGQDRTAAGTAYQAASGPVPGFTATESTAGTKTGAPIVDTPASISVVGQPQIRAQNAQTTTDALTYTPGVFANTYGFDPTTDWYYIRGFQANDVGYYLDGLQLFSYGFAYFQLDPWTLERLDILRGPASALYGGSGPGGIVDAISKRPTLVPYHRVEVGVNNYGNVYGAFDISGPVAQGSPWSYRLAAKGYYGGTQVDHVDFDRGVVAPSLSYRPDGATALTFLGQYQRDFSQKGAFLPYEGSVRSAPFGKIPTNLFTGDTAVSKFEREQSFLGYEFEHTFASNLVFRQNLRFSYVDIDLVGPYGGGYASTPTATSAQLARYNFITTDRSREFTVDNQVQADADTFGVHHVMLAGLDYKHFIIDNNQGFSFTSPLNLLAPQYGIVTTAPNTRYALANNTQDQVGLYAQDQAKFNRLTLLLSAREDVLDTTSDNRLYPAQSGEITPNKLTGRAAAIYDAGYDLHPYAGYATSFNPVLGLNYSTQQLLKPETGEQEEVGVKYGADHGPILATLALFNLTRENVLTTDPTNVLNQVQLGEVRSRGIELGLNATLAEGLSAVGSFTAYSIQTTKDGVASNVGRVPVNVPEVLSSLFVDYTIPDGNLRGLGFTAGERYVGASYADALNRYRVPDYWLTDAGLHYERDGYRIAVTAQNLFDRTYVGSCSAITACFYGNRRTVLGSLSYTW